MLYINGNKKGTNVINRNSVTGNKMFGIAVQHGMT